MSKPRMHSRHGGFSLIEVLISVVVMSFGLLALAALQVSLVRNSAESKAQSIALELARQKMEDLKGFTALNEADGNCANANSNSYQCVTSSGTAETLTDSNGSLGGVNYTRSWTVQRCIASAGAFTCSASNQTATYSGSTPRNEFKAIAVSVAWTDATGASQTVSISDTISALQPSDSSLISKPNASVTPRFARARIMDPGAEAGVIPIAVGGGTETAATNPKPEVIVGSSVVETRFDVLTYAGLNGGTAEAQSRVETAMIGCSCSYDTAPTDTSARGYRPSYWNGFRYTIPESTTTVPPAGVAANVDQSELCEACCRDHHDPVDGDGEPTYEGPKFSPYRSSHTHFNSSTVGATAVTTGTYREACRMIRVEGIFRVATDLYNDYFGLLATEDMAADPDDCSDEDSDCATSSIPDDVSTDNYQAFVVDYMDARYTTGSTSTYNTPSSVNVTGTGGLEGANSLNDPVSIGIAKLGDTRWLHARGLFVDYLEQEAIDAITNAKTSCPSQSGSGLSDCVLKYLPFTSINLTELANYTSANTNTAVVTNNDYSESLDEDDPVRGKVTSGINPPNNATVAVSALSRQSNSGLLDLSFDAISPTDAVTSSDSQTFETSSGAPAADTGDGTFYANLTMPGGYPVQTPSVVSKVTGQTNEACNAGSPVTNNTCPVTKGSNSAGLGFTSSLSIIVGNYNHQVNSTSTASISCAGTGNASTFGTKTTTTSRTVKSCKNYNVSAATNTTTGVAATSFNTVTGPGNLAETTEIFFPLINNGNTVSVTFALEGTTTQTTTCTYYCTALNNTNTNCQNASKTVYQFTTPDCP